MLEDKSTGLANMIHMQLMSMKSKTNKTQLLSQDLACNLYPFPFLFSPSLEKEILDKTITLLT